MSDTVFLLCVKPGSYLSNQGELPGTTNPHDAARLIGFHEAWGTAGAIASKIGAPVFLIHFEKVAHKFPDQHDETVGMLTDLLGQAGAIPIVGRPPASAPAPPSAS